MVKLEDFFENSDKVFLAYKKMIESIVWEDKDFMAHNTIKQIHEFTNNFTTEHAEKDILALRDSMLGLKKQHTDTTEKEGEEVNITEGKMSFRDQLICEIRRKYTFNEDDYAVIKNEMRSQFVGHNAKTFVFKVISDCSKSPKLCSDDSAHIVLGDCYRPELENFLETNDFSVSKEEYKLNDYYIYVNLDE